MKSGVSRNVPPKECYGIRQIQVGSTGSCGPTGTGIQMMPTPIYLLTFPWPETGEVPSILGRYFVPTEKEKAKIRWLIYNFGRKAHLCLKGLISFAKGLSNEVRWR